MTLFVSYSKRGCDMEKLVTVLLTEQLLPEVEHLNNYLNDGWRIESVTLSPERHQETWMVVVLRKH